MSADSLADKQNTLAALKREEQDLATIAADLVEEEKRQAAEDLLDAQISRVRARIEKLNNPPAEDSAPVKSGAPTFIVPDEDEVKIDETPESVPEDDPDTDDVPDVDNE